MTDFLNTDVDILDDSYLYHVAQEVMLEAKRIALASGVALLVISTPVHREAMNYSIDAIQVPFEIEELDGNIRSCSYHINYQEPAPEIILMHSLSTHKGDLMSLNEKNAFREVAKVLGKLEANDVVCRWSRIHHTVSTIQTLENGIELRSTWFAEKCGSEVVFTLLHLGEEIITSRSDVSYLVKQVKEMINKSKTHV